MKALIIGAGIGGIGTAIRLRLKGYDVNVFEANSFAGGKLSEIKDGPYRFDAGPSLFTMPHFVDELFQLAGKNPKDYFQYERLPVVCNYFFEDGTRFSAFADEGKLRREVKEKLKADPDMVIRYLNHSRKLYELTAPIFLEKSLHRWQTYLSGKTVKALTGLAGLDLTKSMDKANRQRLGGHPKLVQLFNRYATYNGSNPYEAPGVLNVIPNLEYQYGAWFPKGGMYSIVKSLKKLADDIGVKFHFNQRVEKILKTGQTATGIKVGGKGINGDLIVSNMDIYPLYEKLLSGEKRPEKILNQERSSSALIFYWGVKKTFSDLDVHNIFFSDSYKEEFDYLFNRLSIHPDPTVYIHISSKMNREDAPEGCENWFVMVNAPHNDGSQDWDALISETRKNIIRKLNRILKTDVDSIIETESVLDPRSIESRTSSHGGSLYGTSSNKPLSAFFRHSNYSSKIKNLYLCGGSVHPGGGIPLCLLSAKIIDEMIPAHHEI